MLQQQVARVLTIRDRVFHTPCPRLQGLLARLRYGAGGPLRRPRAPERLITPTLRVNRSPDHAKEAYTTAANPSSPTSAIRRVFLPSLFPRNAACILVPGVPGERAAPDTKESRVRNEASQHLASPTQRAILLRLVSHGAVTLGYRRGRCGIRRPARSRQRETSTPR